jgi:hypothetical protein
VAHASAVGGEARQAALEARARGLLAAREVALGLDRPDLAATLGLRASIARADALGAGSIKRASSLPAGRQR